MVIQTSLVAQKAATLMALSDGVPRSVFVHRLIMAELERRQTPPTDPEREHLVSEAKRIYDLVGEIDPQGLQRNLHISYREAVSLCETMMARGIVPVTKVRGL